MAKSNDHPFVSVVPDANAWLDEICDELEFADRRDALHALRAALHVLRDRLSPEQNAHLSAQLPTLIRGICEAQMPMASPLAQNTSPIARRAATGRRVAVADRLSAFRCGTSCRR